ncbi:hypothetical protein [Psychroflexus lacisalsi]|nr:hypothetical protein [Psychroflexus lacisalsi]
MSQDSASFLAFVIPDLALLTLSPANRNSTPPCSSCDVDSSS